jgi:hypothetical protein
MRRPLLWLLPILFLLFLVLTGYYLVTTVQQATSPVTDLSRQIGTQVAGLLQPTPTILPDPVTIVREVRSLARLETIQYTIEKVITAETGQGPFGFLFGDRLLLVAHGTVIAGVDLAQLGPDDVWVDEGGRVYMRLPAAEILVSSLDNEATHVYDRDTGLFTRGSIDLESSARLAAELEIRQAALNDGILEQAQVNAEAFLYRFLRSLEYRDVIFAEPDQQPEPTATVTPLPLSTATP